MPTTTISGAVTVKGKTTQPYIKEIRIAVPNTGVYAGVGWDIECTLLEVESNDADPVFDKRDVTWESAAAGYAKQYGDDPAWKGLAWLQVLGIATDRISGVPPILGVYDTKEVSVPPGTIYNPDTRAYTGSIWDGSWIKSFTTDPGWIIADVIADPLAGIASVAPGSYLNKWDALDLSKHCSALVPDGDGGTHCRYNMNITFDQPQKADEMLKNLAGAVGAVIWDNGNGEWRCKIDKQETPAAIFTEENIEGEFAYSHTDVDTRFNDITMTFQNEEFDYREDRVRVWDQANIDATGRRTTSMVAIGCTNRQEAYRRAMMRLRVSLNEYRMVTFTTNRQARFYPPLSTILIADKSLGYVAPSGSTALANTDARDHTTGRIIGMDGPRTTVTLRDPLRLEPGASYTISLTVPNPAYAPSPSTAPTDPDYNKPTIVITRTVHASSPRGDVNTILLTAALPSDTPTNASIALSATGLPTLPKTYRIINSVVADDGERVTLSAIEVDTGKQAASDGVTGSAIETQASDATCPPPLEPATGVLHHLTFDSSYAVNHVLEIDWDRPDSAYINGYKTRYRFNDGPWIDLGTTTDTRIELQNPNWGKYDVEIVTLDRRGEISTPLTASIELDEYNEFGLQGYLTNESHTLPAASDGTVSAYTGASGIFKCFIGAVEVTSDCTFAIQANPQSLTAPITNATGAYSVTAGFDAGEANASVTYRATHTPTGMTLDKVFSLAKSSSGVDAKLLTITADRQTVVYDATDTPSPSTQDTVLTANKINTTATVTWSVKDADGVARTPTTTFLSAATGNTVTMTEAQFAAARNGTTGVLISATLTDGVTLTDKISIAKVKGGTNGLNVMSVLLYKRSPTAPSVPSTTSTLTFATGVLTGHDNGWTQAIPSGTDALYSILATASGTGTTDTIATGEWSTPAIVGINGTYRDIKFLRQLATPSTPTGDSPSGWADTIPTGTDTLWMTIGLKNASGVLQGTWSVPTRLTGSTLRGAYNSSTTYYLYDQVTQGGGTYIALQNGFSAQAPSGTSAATAYWDVVAAPGSAGAPGTPPSAFSATINLTSGAAVNLYTAAVAAGYTGLSDATITFKVPSGVVCRGLGGGGIGLDTGTWPTGYTLALGLVVESGGIVDGGGGTGGDGGTTAATATVGGVGGDAIYLRQNLSAGITINAGGTVRGGSGGGGGGGGRSGLFGPSGEQTTESGGGGGGGGGFPNGSGGNGGAGTVSTGGSGSAGTTSAGGAGGTGSSTGTGGTGGGVAAAAGSTGANGTTGSGYTGRSGAAGGAAGAAIRKNGKTATVTNSGTLTGATVA